MRHAGTNQEHYAYIRCAVATLTKGRPCIVPTATLRELLDTVRPGLGDRTNNDKILAALGEGYATTIDHDGETEILVATTAASQRVTAAPPPPHNVPDILLDAIRAAIKPGGTISNRNAKRLIRSRWMTPDVYSDAIAALSQRGDLEPADVLDTCNRRRRWWRLTEPSTQTPW